MINIYFILTQNLFLPFRNATHLNLIEEIMQISQLKKIGCKSLLKISATGNASYSNCFSHEVMGLIQLPSLKLQTFLPFLSEDAKLDTGDIVSSAVSLLKTNIKVTR